ncbi:MAG: hypothetical protein KY457_02570 [Actinobacteria bacterium]|nr:hypothetical protein [Actinomycetota bacterium]
MTQPDAPLSSDEREEEQRERYRELLEELRTIIPGVQVLFAFLLTVPFASRFEEVDHVGRLAFMVALLSAGVAIVLFLTPASFHRIAPRSQRRERIRLSVFLTVAGMVLLTVAVTAGVYLVARFVFGPVEGQWIAAGIAAVSFTAWYALPFWRRIRLQDADR